MNVENQPGLPASEMVIENQSNTDTSAALADISSDLFGQEGDEDQSSDSTGKEGPDASKADAGRAEVKEPAPSSTEENSEAVQETGAPKTWSKEAIAEWATLPERAKQEILKREEDMFRGLEQYKGAADLGRAYDSVIEPYRAVLSAEGVNPVELFQNFAGNHYMLSKGAPEQKLALAANLLDSYGIDLIELAEHIGNAVPSDPRVSALEREIAELRKGQNQVRNQETQARRSQIDSEVEAFATDPKNIHFSELVDDIAKLMGTGAAASLQQAYDMAVYANPATKAKEQARLTAAAKATADTEAKTRGDKVARLTGTNVTTIPRQRDGTVPLGSLDDTLEETLAAIRSRA